MHLVEKCVWTLQQIKYIHKLMGGKKKKAEQSQSHLAWSFQQPCKEIVSGIK